MKTHLLLSLCASTCLLAACSSMKDKFHYMEIPASTKLTLLPHDTIAVGKTVDVDAKLTSLRNLSLVYDTMLDGKMQLLAVDKSLSDYQHIIPQATQIPGVYHFGFTPKLSGNYRVWADVKPLATRRQEFAIADLGKHMPGEINRAESHEANVGGVHFTLSFDKPVVEGEEVTGIVHVGKGDVSKADIVGFYDDYHTAMHDYDDKERKGPDIVFKLKPVKAGFVKLFTEVTVGGHVVVATFGVNVAGLDKVK